MFNWRNAFYALMIYIDQLTCKAWETIKLTFQHLNYWDAEEWWGWGVEGWWWIFWLLFKFTELLPNQPRTFTQDLNQVNAPFLTSYATLHLFEVYIKTWPFLLQLRISLIKNLNPTLNNVNSHPHTTVTHGKRCTLPPSLFTQNQLFHITYKMQSFKLSIHTRWRK